LEDSSVNLNFTLSKSGKVDHHIKMKIHKFIIFKILGQRWYNFLYVKIRKIRLHQT